MTVQVCFTCDNCDTEEHSEFPYNGYYNVPSDWEETDEYLVCSQECRIKLKLDTHMALTPEEQEWSYDWGLQERPEEIETESNIETYIQTSYP